MLTLEELKSYGADVREGLGRCMNDESFYLMMVDMTLKDKSFERLSDAVAGGDMKASFEAAHALKGIAANVALTPLYGKISALTELLRARQEADYPALLAEILRERDGLLGK